MYKKDLALNNLQWLICYETKPNQNQAKTKPNKLIVSSVLAAVLW